MGATAHMLYMTLTRADGTCFDLGLADYDHPDMATRIAGRREVLANRIKTQTLRLSAGGQSPTMKARLIDWLSIIRYAYRIGKAGI